MVTRKQYPSITVLITVIQFIITKIIVSIIHLCKELVLWFWIRHILQNLDSFLIGRLEPVADEVIVEEEGKDHDDQPGHILNGQPVRNLVKIEIKCTAQETNA